MCRGKNFNLGDIEESTRVEIFILEGRLYAVYNPVALMDGGVELAEFEPIKSEDGIKGSRRG